MPRTTPLVLAALALSSLASPSHASTVFFDGIFANPDWTMSIAPNPGPSSANAFQVLTGGNPNEFRRIQHNLNTSTGNFNLFSLHYNVVPTNTYTPASQGAITSINYSEDSIVFSAPSSSAGQVTGLLIAQGGRTYIQRIPLLVAPVSTTWVPNAASLTASSLYEINTTTGALSPTSNPDFSLSGSTMSFGFYRGNSGFTSYQTDGGIDNWRVEIIPAPSTAAAPLALGGMLALKRRRRR